MTKKQESNSFNPRDYITGFHKRKVEQKKARVQKAIHREKEEKREFRKEKYKKLAAVIPQVDQIDAVGKGILQADTRIL